MPVLRTSRLVLRPFRQDDTIIRDGFTRRAYREIVARADPENLASLRAMSRLGFEASADGFFRLRQEAWESGSP